LKQEIVKIPEFFPKKPKDTVTAQEFISRIDECQVSNDWNDTTTFANFRLCLRGEAEEWLSSTARHLKLTAAQKNWTRIRPLFKREFATTSDDKLIVGGLANLAHTHGENPRKFFYLKHTINFCLLRFSKQQLQKITVTQRSNKTYHG